MLKKNIIKVMQIAILMWISYTLSVFLHEWVHGLLAWIYGYKSSPFNIIYGGYSWQNLLYWANVDQNINSYMIALIGHPYISGIILIVPPIFINGGLALSAGCVLKRKVIYTKNKMILIFVFWLYIWNLGEFFSYTTTRCFSTHADVGLFLRLFDLSPWLIFIPSTYLSVYGMHLACHNFLPKYLSANQIESYGTKIFLFALLLLALLPFAAIRSLGENMNPVVHMISYIAIGFLPILAVVYWRVVKQ